MSADSLTESCKNVFIWRIINCGVFKHDKDHPVHSPKFKFDSLTGGKWYFSLTFYPGGIFSSDTKYASVFLTIDTNDVIVCCEFSIEILGADGSVFHSKTKRYDVNYEDGCGWDDYIEIDELQNKMPDEILILQCKLHELSASLSTKFNKLAETTLGMDRISFNYFVESLNTLDPESQTFDCPTLSTYTIYVGRHHSNITIELRKHYQHNLEYLATLKVILFDINGLEHYSRTYRVHFPDDSNLCQLQPSIPMTLLPDEKTKLPRKITFNLVCEFTVYNQTITYRTESNISQSLPCLYPPPRYDKLSDLQEKLLSMYINKKFCDVTLQVDKKTFSVHRFVLSARSPVFCEIFKTSNLNCFKITGVESQTLEKFLNYLYVGIVETLDYETAFKLLMLANRYEVSSLKDKCLCFLKQILLEKKITSDSP